MKVPGQTPTTRIVPHSASVERINSAQKFVHRKNDLVSALSRVEKLTFVYFNQVKRAANKHELRTLRDNLNYAMRAQDAVVDATSSDEVVRAPMSPMKMMRMMTLSFGLDEYIKRPYELPATRTTAIETEVDVLVGRLESEAQKWKTLTLLTRSIRRQQRRQRRRQRRRPRTSNRYLRASKELR